MGVGHGVFEGRKPALLDGFVQSMVAAPLFVHMEVLFAMGLKAKVAEEVERKVDARLKDTGMRPGHKPKTKLK